MAIRKYQRRVGQLNSCRLVGSDLTRLRFFNYSQCRPLGMSKLREWCQCLRLVVRMCPCLCAKLCPSQTPGDDSEVPQGARNSALLGRSPAPFPHLDRTVRETPGSDGSSLVRTWLVRTWFELGQVRTKFKGFETEGELQPMGEWLRGAGIKPWPQAV